MADAQFPTPVLVARQLEKTEACTGPGNSTQKWAGLPISVFPVLHMSLQNGSFKNGTILVGVPGIYSHTHTIRMCCVGTLHNLKKLSSEMAGKDNFELFLNCADSTVKTSSVLLFCVMEVATWVQLHVDCPASLCTQCFSLPQPKVLSTIVSTVLQPSLWGNISPNIYITCCNCWHHVGVFLGSSHRGSQRIWNVDHFAGKSEVS